MKESIEFTKEGLKINKFLFKVIIAMIIGMAIGLIFIFISMWEIDNLKQKEKIESLKPLAITTGYNGSLRISGKELIFKEGILIRVEDVTGIYAEML